MPDTTVMHARGELEQLPRQLKLLVLASGRRLEHEVGVTLLCLEVVRFLPLLFFQMSDLNWSLISPSCKCCTLSSISHLSGQGTCAQLASPTCHQYLLPQALLLGFLLGLVYLQRLCRQTSFQGVLWAISYKTVFPASNQAISINSGRSPQALFRIATNGCWI